VVFAFQFFRGVFDFCGTFNFSANHLLLLSRTEYRTYVVFLMQDYSTRRVYRLYDFTKSRDHVRPLLLRIGKGRRRGQTVPGLRVGQEGHPTQPVFYSSCSCRRRGRITHEVTVYTAGKKLAIEGCLFLCSGQHISASRPRTCAIWLTLKPAKVDPF
jgi:hypothetical protein